MDERVKKAYTIIKKDYQNKILLDTLATKVGLSKYHLHRLFKTEFKETPSECLLRTRLELARHYLKLKTQMSMSQLATESGFSSLAVFSRAFSRRYGITPTEMLRQRELRLDSYDNQIQVEIVDLPEIRLYYEATNFLSKTLASSFDRARSRAKKLGRQGTGRRIGVMNHLSVHDSKQPLNYYAGIEIDGKVLASQLEDLLIIQKGKYATFNVTSERETFIQELINLKYHWLDSSRYQIRELFALEEILDDSMRLRKIYIPVKRK
jgi:AraC-like DNA-binding protein/predicted transcriptional regulator YdeE